MSAARRRPWTTAQQGIASALECELTARTAWDELPGLYVIVDLPLPGDVHALVPVPVSDALWQGKPEHALSLIAVGIAAGTISLRGNAPVHGLAIRTEGWTLTTGQGQQPPRPGTLRADPRRAEARFIHAIDRTGAAYLSSLRRGQNQPETVVDLPGQPPAIQGAIPGALRLLTRALAQAPHLGKGTDAPGR